MGFREGAFATVWEITATGDNFSKIRVSTSRKDKKTDEYVTDFNGFVSLIGEANKKLSMIEEALDQDERCRIKLGACDVSNRYDKEAEREYTNFTLFDFEIAGDRTSSEEEKPAKATKKTKPATKKKPKAAPPLDDEDEDAGDEDLPF